MKYVWGLLLCALTGCVSPSWTGPNPGIWAIVDRPVASSSELLWELRTLGVSDVKILDRTYYIPTREEALSWVRSVPFHPYVKESYDCDDYALEAMTTARRAFRERGVLMGLAVGFIAFEDEGEPHAAVVFRTSDKQWRVYDATRGFEVPWPKVENIYYIVL